MGQKVNPIGFRLAVQKDWRSKWYASEREYTDFLHSDIQVRQYLKTKLMQASISKIVIERAWNLVRVTLHTARPGLVIGRKGQEIDVMSQKISEMCGGKQVKIDIFEIKQPELDAQLVAETVTQQLERRISFRRAMKRAVQTSMDMGADGIRIRVAGRLGGADIARDHFETFWRAINGQTVADADPQTGPAGRLAIEPRSETLPEHVWWGSGSRSSAEWAGKMGLNLMSSTLLTEATGQPFASTTGTIRARLWASHQAPAEVEGCAEAPLTITFAHCPGADGELIRTNGYAEVRTVAE